MKKKNFSFCLILIFALKIERALTITNCVELITRNSFGLSFMSSNSCFTHSIETLREMIIFYTNTSVTGISFELINCQNFSYMTNMGFTKSEKIDLTNTYLIGVEVWTGE
jgi:hypothetical protein